MAEYKVIRNYMLLTFVNINILMLVTAAQNTEPLHHSGLRGEVTAADDTVKVGQRKISPMFVNNEPDQLVNNEPDQLVNNEPDMPVNNRPDYPDKFDKFDGCSYLEDPGFLSGFLKGTIISPRCPENTIILDFSSLGDQIVEMHNAKRNAIAAHELASKMQKMIWDNGLAHLAQRHMASCRDTVDSQECLKEAGYPTIGQLKYSWRNNSVSLNKKEQNIYLGYAFSHWTALPSDIRGERGDNIPDEFANKFSNIPFQTILLESNTRVGCAGRMEKSYFEILCNYKQRGLPNFPVYSKSYSTPADECMNGEVDSKYKNLCAVRTFLGMTASNY